MFDETFQKGENTDLHEAGVHFRKAYELQMAGRLQDAIAEYQRSLERHPTAEAFTFMGWAYSHLGDYAAAISKCESAISVDPDFGNPYNDIGAYLISLQRLDEAIPWLEKAKHARRYEARHYPFFNLGRIFEMQGRWFEAIAEYRGALHLYPNYQSAKDAVTRLQILIDRRN